MDQREEKIKIYLSNEAKLYEDWYKGLSKKTDDDPYTQPVSIDSSIKITKKRFKNWFDQNEKLLQDKVCIEWDYPRKKEELPIKPLLIAAVSDVLAFILQMPINMLATATILIIEGYLDRLCGCLAKE